MEEGGTRAAWRGATCDAMCVCVAGERGGERYPTRCGTVISPLSLSLLRGWLSQPSLLFKEGQVRKGVKKKNTVRVFQSSYLLLFHLCHFALSFFTASVQTRNPLSLRELLSQFLTQFLASFLDIFVGNRSIFLLGIFQLVSQF